ncbi:YqgE/AlgH family protein [Staphylococcus chromogenes]|nr:YqgE/AlgH family protein [Staphylococcus chromogenes]
MPELFGDSLFAALEKNPLAAGKLLIAAPDLDMGYFTRALLLVLSHDENGTLAIGLNARTDQAVANFLPELDEIVASPKALYTGGMDGMHMVRTLGILKPGVSSEEAEKQEFIFAHLGSRIVALNGGEDVEKIKEWVSSVRLFAGQVAWAPGELEAEIDEGRWYVTDALSSDITAPARIDAWAETLRRQPLPLPLFATTPIDPLDN